MAELERELRALSAHLDWPAEPSLAGRVRAGLGERRGRPWRLVAVALAVLAVAIGAAFAVPQSRATILRWLGLEGVRIELVDELPSVRPSRELQLGRRVSMAEARRLVDFRILDSDLLGKPDAVYWDGRQVSFVYGSSDRVRLLVSQFSGAQQPAFIKKIAAPGTRVLPVTVDDEPGYFISGAPHFLYMEPTGQVREERIRLARDTLLWQRGFLTLRLEGELTAERALEIARSFG